MTLPLAAQIGTTFFTFFPLLVATRLDDDCVLMTITALNMTLVTPRNVSDKLGEKKKNTFRINNKPQDLSRTNYFGPRIDISRIARKI